MQKTGRAVLVPCAVVVGILLALAGRAQAPPDPVAALSEINKWYSDQIKQARDNKTPLDMNALLAERKAKAAAALKDADPAKTDPAKCLALAQLYQIVQQNKEALAAAQRYLTSNPEPALKYTAQQIALNGYQSLGDADGILKTLDEMKPTIPQMAANLASSTAQQYAMTVADKKGLQAGLDLIKKMEGQVPFDQFKTVQEKNIADSTIAGLALGRSALYEKAGKHAEALAALDEGVKKLGPGNRYASLLESK